MKNIKSRRGFSLVELMVVVAIMGVLAAIAIPAYNEYRKSAKKTAYRSDLLSLHKGWLAFGVELDSYCDRETTPTESSIGNVGMQSLLSSNLYADKPGKNNFIGFSGFHSDCSLGTWASNTYNATARSLTNQVYTAGAITDAHKRMAIRVVDVAGSTPAVTQCELNVAEYEMGVVGHISGDNFIGFSVDENGVVDEENEAVFATLQGTGGVCT